MVDSASPRGQYCTCTRFAAVLAPRLRCCEYMGVVIELKDQLADRSRPRGGSRAAFFFDLACPFSYLVAERVERVLGEVEWIPAPAVGLDGGARWARFEAARALAEREALAARLPLVWPDRFPANTRHALRAASYAADNGAGASVRPGCLPPGLLRRLRPGGSGDPRRRRRRGRALARGLPGRRPRPVPRRHALGDGARASPARRAAPAGHPARPALARGRAGARRGGADPRTRL